MPVRDTKTTTNCQ